LKEGSIAQKGVVIPYIDGWMEYEKLQEEIVF
jgi:hypothetical protein